MRAAESQTTGARMELEERTRDQNHVNTHPVVLLKVTGARVELEERTRNY